MSRPEKMHGINPLQNQPLISERDLRLQSYGCEFHINVDQPNETTSLINNPGSPASSASALAHAMRQGTRATLALSRFVLFRSHSLQETINQSTNLKEIINQNTKNDCPGKGRGYSPLA